MPLFERPRGFDFCSHSLAGKGLGVRFEKKSYMVLISLSVLLINHYFFNQQSSLLANYMEMLYNSHGIS